MKYSSGIVLAIGLTLLIAILVAYPTTPLSHPAQAQGTIQLEPIVGGLSAPSL
jgi:hypothetical protein